MQSGIGYRLGKLLGTGTSDNIFDSRLLLLGAELDIVVVGLPFGFLLLIDFTCI